MQPQNEKTTPRFNMYWCRKHTENWPYLCKSQVKVSFLFDEWIWAFLATKLCQSINLLPVSALREEISSVICPIMVWWLRIILYRIENRSLRGIEPTQVSSQNLASNPSFSLNFGSPCKKCESPGLISTLGKVFEFTYLFPSRVCHVPCSFINWKSHLPTRHFSSWRTATQY